VTLYISPDYGGEVNEDDLCDLPAILEGVEGRSSRLPGIITSWLWQPPWHDGPGLMVRQYAHGGLWGRLAGTLFCGKGRMLDELRLTMRALRCGVPTAPPVAVRVERVGGPFLRAHYVSERILETTNLLDFFAGLDAEGPLPTEQGGRLAAGVADAVARMHDAGILHGDLNLKNLLVRDAFDEPQVFLVDFDRARLVGDLSLRQRLANLLRLDRSVMKWAASRRAVGPKDRLRLLRAYLARYPQWSARWGEVARRYGSRHLLHRLSRQPD
jgi:TP53 regulating kinase-like protein